MSSFFTHDNKVSIENIHVLQIEVPGMAPHFSKVEIFLT